MRSQVRKEVIGVSISPDVKKVFDEQRGMIRASAYADYILREYFTQRGLLPEKVPA